MKKTLTVVALLAFAATARAQVVVHEHEGNSAKGQQLQVLMEKITETGVHVSVEARPVTGAPYSAEAVRESIQVLADGNRIVRRSVSRVYRDGNGRTRREELGPDGQVLSITISDPANGTSVVLDPEGRTAHRARVATFTPSSGVAGGTTSDERVTLYVAEPKPHAELKAAREAGQKAEPHAGATAPVTREHVTVSLAGPVTWTAAHATVTSSPASTVDLGQQVIEGVPATGTRTTTVISAGAIGNEQPITVTSEEWYSPDFKVLVMTKHADPRAGDTTYRLTGITRSEPDPSLFQLPAGVTIK